MCLSVCDLKKKMDPDTGKYLLLRPTTNIILYYYAYYYYNSNYLLQYYSYYSYSLFMFNSLLHWLYYRITIKVI